LTNKGIEEASQCGKLLLERGFNFDIAHTSLLTRTIRTWNVIAAEMDQDFIPLHKTWRLNERHYGSLQGYNKVDMENKLGAEKTN